MGKQESERASGEERESERKRGGEGETRSSLCTDLLSREHFNYSTLLTKFQL